MGDDRDPALSSDDLLRAARAEAESPSFNLEPPDTRRSDRWRERRADASAADDPAPDGPVPSAERSVVGTARLAPAGDLFARLKRSEYLLTVDGHRIARVTTGYEFEPASGFRNAASFRVTSVVFLDRDGLRWHISAEEPGPPRVKTKRSGKEKELLFSAHERRLYVREEPMPRLMRADSNVENKRLAETVGDLQQWRASSEATVVASGTSFSLRPVRVGARRGAIGDLALIARDYPLWLAPWSVNTTSAVPLSVILLYWHLLMGDFTRPGGGA